MHIHTKQLRRTPGSDTHDIENGHVVFIFFALTAMLVTQYTAHTGRHITWRACTSKQPKDLPGSPLCSCSTTMSVKSCDLHVSTRSVSTMPPRLMRCAFGMTNFISCVHMRTRVHVHVCTSVYACVYVCTCLHTYPQLFTNTSIVHVLFQAYSALINRSLPWQNCVSMLPPPLLLLLLLLNGKPQLVGV